MPPAKNTPRKRTRKAAKTTKRPGPRKMSTAHKKALSDGRAMSATVDRYLSAIATPGRRGRKVSKATLQQRLGAAEVRLRASAGVARVLAAQEVRDLRARLSSLDSTGGADIKALQTDFIKVAKRFGDNRGISYAAWRDAGVSADVLKRAGVARIRG
jgi:hypothetical protein